MQSLKRGTPKFRPVFLIDTVKGNVVLLAHNSDVKEFPVVPQIVYSGPTGYNGVEKELKRVLSVGREIAVSLGKDGKGFYKQLVKDVQTNKFQYGVFVTKKKYNELTNPEFVLVNWEGAKVRWITVTGVAQDFKKTYDQKNGPKPSSYTTGGVALAASKLPGYNSMVHYPCSCGKTNPAAAGKQALGDIIMHLNDTHKWTRNKIADWIDDLHDKKIINAEFAPWEESK